MTYWPLLYYPHVRPTYNYFHAPIGDCCVARGTRLPCKMHPRSVCMVVACRGRVDACVLCSGVLVLVIQLAYVVTRVVTCVSTPTSGYRSSVPTTSYNVYKSYG